MTAGDSLQRDIDMAARILREFGAREVFVFGSASHALLAKARRAPPDSTELSAFFEGKDR